MKKYLMTGIAALAMGGLFTSCGPGMDTYGGNPADYVKQTYEQKFIQAFGEPAPNQTWGFGSSTVATTRGMTRAVDDYDGYKGTLQPVNVSFPSDCEASKFIDKVPEGINKFPEGGDASAASGPYFIDATTKRVNMYSGAGVIYVDGTVDLSSDNCFEIPQNTEIYLVKGSKFIIGENDANKLKAIIYIESTATLETANRLKMDNTSKVYNHGTINAGAFEVNNTSFLYNVGTLNAPNGLVYVANNNSSIVNDGTIIAGNVEVAGSGHVQNNAEWTVNNTTTVNSNSASWINNGHWTTNYYSYTAGSENVINNCFLEVKEDFDINLGDGGGTKGFKIDAGGGVLTKNFNGGKNGNNLSGPYRILMGSKAVFKVTGTAALASANVGTWQGGPTYGYGFYGVGDDYAVFQATHIVKGQPDVPGDKKVQYGGKLYVSSEDHFASELNEWNQCVTFSLGFTKENIFTTSTEDEYSTGKPSITINQTPCNPGFSGDGEGGGISDNTETVRIIAEDLTVNGNSNDNTDFDFNDIVFDVIRDNDNGKIWVKFLAAGGQLPIFIGEGDDAWELHQLFKEANPDRNISTSVMMNTYEGQHNAYTCPLKELPESWWSGSSIKEIAKSIKIRVKKSSVPEAIVLDAPEGQVPSKIAVGNDYEWCDEREAIDTKFNGKFSQYVQGQLGDTWYK